MKYFYIWLRDTFFYPGQYGSHFDAGTDLED